MGSTAEIVISGAHDPGLLQWAVERIDALEACWSRFRSDSELRRVERDPHAKCVPASPDLIDAIGRALSLWFVTDGRFDPTVRDALEANGYDRTFREVPADGPALLGAREPAPGCTGLRVDRELGTVTIPRGVRLDLGGVGKGLAADIVATGLVERGAAGACVGLGGDIRAVGAGFDGEAWEVPVEDPREESVTLCTRRLRDEAIVTSTTRFRRWSRGGRRLHHIIDPATGAPTDAGVIAVIAQAGESWWAEGIAKAALVAGVPSGLELLDRLGIAAVVFDDCGGRYTTQTWELAPGTDEGAK